MKNKSQCKRMQTKQYQTGFNITFQNENLNSNNEYICSRSDAVTSVHKSLSGNIQSLTLLVEKIRI